MSVRPLPLALAAAALVSVLAGYADLWRGGTSLAAALLVLGYVLLAPIALWRAAGPATTDGPEADPPPYGIAAAVGLAVWLLYVATLAPSTAMWDTSEYIAAAKVLGIPHPPGNPLFVLIAHTFALLPVPLEYAGRVNLLAATTSALSAGLWFLVTFRALRGWQLPRWPRATIAALSAWIGATAFTVWNQSVVNEKVYTVAMLGVALVAWVALRWQDAPEGSRRADWLLVLAAYLCGLGYANHPAGFLPLPALGLFVLWQRPRTLLRWPVLAGGAAALLIGLTPFAYQPIRTPFDPPINVGEPSMCVGAPRLDCTLTAGTWERLMANVNREQYGGHRVTERQAPITAQVGMWWLYFRWQWWRDLDGTSRGVQGAVALLFLGLGALGAVTHWRRDRTSFAFVGPLIATLTPLLIVYLNFKYGASQAPELGNLVPREVRDRDYFYLWSFASWGVWAGLGLGAVWQWVAQRLGGAGPVTGRAWAMAAPVLLLAAVPVLANARVAPRTGHTFTREWAHDLLESVEPYGVLVTMGDNDSFPLWYAQHVEGVRPDVTLAVTPYLGTDWYVRQLIRQPQREYTGGVLPVYDSLATTRPTGPVLRLTPQEADAIQQYVQLSRPQVFEAGSIRATVPAGFLRRDHLVVLQLIRDAFPERPIYFSSATFPRELGLDPYIVTQGLASKLLPDSAAIGGRYIPYPGGHFDLERTRELWAAYRAPAALLAEGRWTDDASVGVPAQYMVLGQMLSQAEAMVGDSVAAAQRMEQTMALARLTRLAR
jgi:hypothetical protein